jgi:hypothetical protein
VTNKPPAKLPIDMRAIAAVMLGDQWILVDPGSFALDAYEFSKDGTDEGVDDCTDGAGFSFSSGTDVFFGPVSAIRAVRCKQAVPS